MDRRKSFALVTGLSFSTDDSLCGVCYLEDNRQRNSIQADRQWLQVALLCLVTCESIVHVCSYDLHGISHTRPAFLSVLLALPLCPLVTLLR